MTASGPCQKCGKHGYLMHLHGGQGGPLMCPICCGEWNAKHTRRRKFGRILAKAAQLYFENGGKFDDAKAIISTGGIMGFAAFGIKVDPGLLDPLGYMDSTKGDDVCELTSELLADTLQLTHPDRHPPERQDLATRVTQQLLELQPFVFPAPKPKPAKPTTPPPRNGSDDVIRDEPKKPSQRYPCELCCETVPRFYCATCKAEWTKRQEAKRERERAKRREQYKRRMELKRWRQRQKICAAVDCDKPVTSKRKDALYCSPACRQRVHRHRVTAQSSNHADLDRAVTARAAP